MKQDLISKLFREEVLNLSAYKIADAHDLIKLDAMENPYTWPENIKDQWLKSIRNCSLNRYPDPEAGQLSSRLRQVNQIPEQSSILLGNGSDEIIQLLLMALPPQATVMAPDPGFVMYQQIADTLGLSYLNPSLLEQDFNLNMDAMLPAIKQYKPAIIFLAYPNNPTGNLFDQSDVETIIQETSGLVILDEAYAPFANASFINKLPDYDNLLVMRTVSKLGLAGLRLGFIAGNTAVIQQLNKIRLPYNINSLTQLTAEFAFIHHQIFEQQTQQICSDRALLFTQINQLEGFKAYPSAANFILFRTPKDQATAIFQHLKKQGILIKNLSPQAGLLTDCLRVTIGKPEENNIFIDALSEYKQNSD